MLYVWGGFVLMVGGVEVFLYGHGWWSLGVVLIGLGFASFPEPQYHVALKSTGILAFSLYFTATAFTRYRGLAKDVDPTPFNVVVYGLQIVAVVAAGVLVMTAVGRRVRRARA